MIKVKGPWLSDPGTQQILTLLEEAGFKAYVVGGCVRNALLGQPVRDVDIATDARPEQGTEVLSAAGIKVVPTGIDHGTITAVANGIGHEITTFRRDVESFGRRAVVSFSDDIEEDARRRDFTINALYADRHGNVLDPIGGLADLRARRIRFIDDADERIREDYLRALRFFRFHAWYGDPEAGMDQEALAAIAENLDGLETLSRERVGSEILRLLEAPDPAPAVAAMARCGALARVLPGADDRFLAALVHNEGDLPPRAIRRLAILGGEDVARRLRLSRRDARRLERLREGMAGNEPVAALAYRFGKDEAVDIELLRATLAGRPPAEDMDKQAARGAAAVFPVKARDLMPALSGPELGKRLKELERRWIESGFTLTREELLSS